MQRIVKQPVSWVPLTITSLPVTQHLCIVMHARYGASIVYRYIYALLCMLDMGPVLHIDTFMHCYACSIWGGIAYRYIYALLCMLDMGPVLYIDGDT